MNCQEVKEQIENNTLIDPFIIFVCKHNKFLANQYVNAIKNNLGISYITYLEKLENNNNFADIFNIKESSSTDTLRVFNTDKLIINTDAFINEKNLIIITNTIDDETASLYRNYIVELPKLEYWQIKDYMYSILENIDTRYIDWLISNCNSDIYRLQQEADKLTIFNEQERNILFEQMLEDDAFSDITNQGIFDFTDAIVKKNKNGVIKIYQDIENMDVEPLGLVTILYQNFRKLIQVWLNRNATPENTGLSSKQIYAINKIPRVWNQTDLITIFNFLTEIDYKIKTGQLPVQLLRDYIVVKLFSR